MKTLHEFGRTTGMLVVLGLALASTACGDESNLDMEGDFALEPGEPTSDTGDFHDAPDGGKEDRAIVTIADLVRAKRCSTAPAAGISLQLAEELACLHPDRFVRIGNLAGLDLNSAALPYLEGTAARALETALTTLAETRPGTLEINSTWRSIAQQFVIKRWEGSCGIGEAAAPGESLHESGLAIDTPDAGTRAVRDALRGAGFTWYCSTFNRGRYAGCRDAVHFEVKGTGVGSDTVLAFQKLWNLNNPRNLIDEDGKWGAATERKMLLTPLAGFARGSTCAAGDPL